MAKIIFLGGRRIFQAMQRTTDVEYISTEEFLRTDVSIQSGILVIGSSFFLKRKYERIDFELELSIFLSKIKLLNIEKVIFLSSVSVYGLTSEVCELSEGHPYASQDLNSKEKIQIENCLFQNFFGRLVVLRLPGLFAFSRKERTSYNLIDRILNACETNKSIEIDLHNSGRQLRDFTSVEFLVTVINQSIKFGNNFLVMNVAEYGPILISDLVSHPHFNKNISLKGISSHATAIHSIASIECIQNLKMLKNKKNLDDLLMDYERCAAHI